MSSTEGFASVVILRIPDLAVLEVFQLLFNLLS